MITMIPDSSTTYRRNTYTPLTTGHSKNAKNASVMKDGQSRIDYVLVYNNKIEWENEERKAFEAKLKREDLRLEKETEDNLTFIKIHAPKSTLKRNCEIIKLRMPVTRDIRNEIGAHSILINTTGYFAKLKLIIGYILNIFCIKTNFLPKEPYKLTEEYSSSKSFIFDDNNHQFFSTSDRCMIVNFILERTSAKDNENVGITKLLENGIYVAAYPPHEGTLEDPSYERGQLTEEWASWSKTFDYQPLDKIKDYFGMKFALYFAWLGFYTHMLVPASIFSILFLLYGFVTWSSDHLSNEVCNPKSDIILCPQCDNNCDYWNITEACSYYRFRYLIDNDMTPFYVFCMSIWSAVYLKRWKQYSAEIKHRWGLIHFTLYPETIRTQSSACSCSKRNSTENKLHRLMKLPCILFTYSIMIFLVSLAAICVLLTIFYNMMLVASQYLHGEIWNKYQKSVLVPVTSAILYYIIITMLNLLYNWFAQKLTEWEFHRTQSEFDDSLQLKIYIFQFVNYYFIFFYIAFIKGRLIGHPGSYIRIFGYRQEECEPGGCLMEICIQIVIFMIAEQLRDNVMEYVWPLMKKLWMKQRHKLCFTKCFYFLTNMRSEEKEQGKRWIEDFKLNPIDNSVLFDEYLEMVVQYGYVTLFIAACPWAPILALFNNSLIEIRLDAKKFIKFYRRPVAQRVPDIGIWFFIMKTVAKLSIFTNACIIASSTNLIPMWMYKVQISDNFTTIGFVNHSLSHFDIRDFENGSTPTYSTFNVTSCRYFDYRNPLGTDSKYEKTDEYWHILVARLAFIIVYQALVSFVVTIIKWWSPDIPKELLEQIKKEERHISEIIATSFRNNQTPTVLQSKRTSVPVYNGNKRPSSRENLLK